MHDFDARTERLGPSVNKSPTDEGAGSHPFDGHRTDIAQRSIARAPREVLEVDMKIGVSGASGHLGRAVVSELLQRSDGHEVVAITRTPETVSGPAQGRFGDYNQPEGLAEAYAGLDRLLIISTVDPEPGKRGAQNVAAIDAAVKASVKHIVFMSG